MDLLELVSRPEMPPPWTEDYKLPWSDPAFSERMLRQHLDQEHGRASRTFDVVDEHVGWIHGAVLGGEPSKVLDLCCGPGLYVHRLAKLGHRCTGIDYGPASIAWARATAEEEGIECELLEGDVGDCDLPSECDAVLMVFGELNTFPPDEAREVLRRAADALADGGALVLETHTFDAVRAVGSSPPHWHTNEEALFGEEPYLALREAAWNEEEAATTERWWVVDAATASVERYLTTLQAYTDEQYEELLRELGFEHIERHPGLGGPEAEHDPQLFVLVARKGAPR